MRQNIKSMRQGIVAIALFLALLPNVFCQKPSLYAIIDSAEVLTDQEHFAESIALLNSVEPQITDDTPPKTRFKFNLNQSYNLFITYAFSKAEKYGLRAVKIAENVADSAMRTAAYSQMGNLYSFQKMGEKSLIYQRKALAMIPPGDSANYYFQLVNLTNVLSDMGKYGESLEKLLRARRFFEQNGDTVRSATVNNNIGEIYRRGFKDFPKAITHYRFALAENQKSGYMRGMIENYHNLAVTYSEMQNWDSALANIHEANVLRKQIGDEGGLVHGYNVLGEVYAGQENWSEAGRSFKRMKELSENNAILPGIYYSNVNLARVMEGVGKSDASYPYLSVAASIADSLNNKELQMEIGEMLYQWYKQKGSYRKALTQLEKVVELDSIEKSDEHRASLDEMRVKYENELAISENKLLKTSQQAQAAELANQRQLLWFFGIALVLILIFGVIVFMAYRQRNEAYIKEAEAREILEKQYVQLKTSEENLKKANELKNLIFSVIGHDFREPLAALSQILSLTSSGDLTREETNLLLTHIQGQTDSNLRSLQNVLMWARNQIEEGSVCRKTFDVSTVIEGKLDKYNAQIRNKDLKIEVRQEGGNEFWADLNQFKSMMQNLLSNAIKFSPEGETIRIETFTDSHYHTVRIADGGEGVPEDFLQQLSESSELVTRKGTLGEKGIGIGLRLVIAFAEAHGGHFNLKNRKDGGTIAEIQLPTRSYFARHGDVTDAA